MVIRKGKVLLPGKIMEKFLKAISGPLEKMAEFLQTNVFASSIVHGLSVAIPVTIIGGLCTLLTSAPDPSILSEGNIFHGLLAGWFALSQGALGQFASLVNKATMSMLAVYSLISITDRLADQFELDRVNSVVNAIIIFLMIACFQDGALIMNYMGGNGLFSAMLVACLVTYITHLCVKNGLSIKLPASVPPFVAAPFTALIPLVINVVVFYLLSVGCQAAFGVLIPQFILNITKPLLSASDSVWAVIIYAFLLNALWLIGVNGGNIVNSTMSAFLLMNIAENAAAHEAGLPMTHNVMVYSPNTAMINFGGSGSALALVIAALIVARSQHLKTMTKLGGFGTIFNISEPIVYGYPVVLNTFIALPFVLLPIFNGVSVYFAMELGLIGRPYINIPWVIPTPIQLFLQTLDWKAFVFSCVLLVINVVVYMPFVKAFDNSLLAQEKTEEE